MSNVVLQGWRSARTKPRHAEISGRKERKFTAGTAALLWASCEQDLVTNSQLHHLHHFLLGKTVIEDSVSIVYTDTREGGGQERDNDGTKAKLPATRTTYLTYSHMWL